MTDGGRDEIEDRLASRFDDPPTQTSTPDEPQQDTGPEPDTEPEPQPPSSNGLVSIDQVPYVHRRDAVKEDRNDVIQIPALEDTLAEDTTGLRALDDRFEKEVPKLDRREAVYLAGLRNLDDAEAQLREWGHGLKE